MSQIVTASGTPSIVAPTMRLLAVSEPATSIAFYTNVLGFRDEVVRGDHAPHAVAELVHGAARLQLVARETGAEAMTSLAPASILFFVTDDVAGMREAIRARGGSPSELEKVNWIKMRMFEVRDPDGHVLWFGQSFQEADDEVDSQVRAARQCRTIMPELPLGDVPAGVDADALHAELVASGANVQGEPVSQPWGLREFHILDPEGNRIGFGQTFE